MKSELEVQARLRGLLVQELDRRVEEATKRLPYRCRFNHRQALDVRRTVEGETNENYNRTVNGKSLPVIGMCGHGMKDPTEWSGTICEDPIDAQRCPIFEPRQNKEEIKREFEEQLRTPEWVQANLPEIAGLCWALDVVRTPILPWWKKVWFWLLKIRLEPVLTPKEAAVKLLGSNSDGQELLQDLYKETANVDDSGAGLRD